MDLKQIVASCLYDGSWDSEAKAENERNFLKARRKLNKDFAIRYGESNGYQGWWLDGLEVWRTDWAMKQSAMLCLHLKKQEEKIDLMFCGVDGLSLKGDLQPAGSRWAAEIRLMAFQELQGELHCAIACREGFTLRMKFKQVAVQDKT